MLVEFDDIDWEVLKTRSHSSPFPYLGSFWYRSRGNRVGRIINSLLRAMQECESGNVFGHFWRNLHLLSSLPKLMPSSLDASWCASSSGNWFWPDAKPKISLARKNKSGQLCGWCERTWNRPPTIENIVVIHDVLRCKVKKENGTLLIAFCWIISQSHHAPYALRLSRACWADIWPDLKQWYFLIVQSSDSWKRIVHLSSGVWAARHRQCVENHFKRHSIHQNHFMDVNQVWHE